MSRINKLLVTTIILLLFSVIVFAQKPLIPSNELLTYLPTSIPGYSVEKNSTINFTRDFVSIASKKYVKDNLTNAEPIRVVVFCVNELDDTKNTVDNMSINVDNLSDNNTKTVINEDNCSITEEKREVMGFSGVLQSINCADNNISYIYYLPLIVQKDFMLSLYCDGAKNWEDILNIINAIDLKGLSQLG